MCGPEKPMPDWYCSDEVRDLVRAKAKAMGGQAALAAAAGISPSFLSDVLAGRREPSGALLAFMALRRHVSYVSA